MANLVFFVFAVAVAVSFRSMMLYEQDDIELAETVEETNGATWSFGHYLLNMADIYGIPVGQQFISFVYTVYMRLTFFNMVIFLFKYVPPGFYMYKLMKNIYETSRERLKAKQNELEDIQLKIQIVNTKLYVRDAEFNERAEILRRDKDRLRRVRARVRELIAADEALRHALVAAANCDQDMDMHVQVQTTQDDNEFITELLKGLKGDKYAIPDRLVDKMDCGEYPLDNDPSPDNSIYSSLSDMDVRQDCRVKIVKVTNVYKVAYLKHFIKQRRLRRANKRALLKKKMENIKKLMEDWQKTLNMVINRSIMNIVPHPIDVASQEAMGDYSKPRDSTSDTDLRNCSDFYDEYSWTNNPYRPYSYNYEDVPETAVSREYYGEDLCDVKYIQQCESGREMLSIVEETGSQMAIEEIASEAGDAGEDPDCRDIIAI